MAGAEPRAEPQGHTSGMKRGYHPHQFQNGSIQMITDVAVDPAGNWNSYFGGALWITVSIAGAAMLAKTAQTQQAMSISIMKKAADQQNRMADLLARNAQQAFPPAPDSGYGFSTYA